jgi:hypothetical protein
MSNFELNYKQEINYDNKIDFSIRLELKPSKVDLDSILDAIETIEDFSNKYLLQKNQPIIIKSPK